VLDEHGAEVCVTGRYGLTSAPALVAVGRHRPRRVTGWAGPWPVVEL